MIDIVDIKKQVKEGAIIPYISHGNVCLSNECGEVVCIGSVEELTREVESFSTEQTPKTGYWKSLPGGTYKCSSCGQEVRIRLNYCHKCGAKMGNTTWND